MEIEKLLTVDDLFQSDDERVELINGHIIKRPMARSEHGLVQSSISDEILPLKKKTDKGGWWIIPEISVRYNEHQCPSHDLAGWRKERIPQRPCGVMDDTPDWVCEITSPGHESKDTVDIFLLIQRYKVPYYWIIWPEKKALMVYKLIDDNYVVITSIACQSSEDFKKISIEPFKEIEMDLAYIFGDY